MNEPKVFVFDKKEIVVFLIVFICINVLFFALGVKVGQINPSDQTHHQEHASNDGESVAHETMPDSKSVSSQHTTEHSSPEKVEGKTDDVVKATVATTESNENHTSPKEVDGGEELTQEHVEKKLGFAEETQSQTQEKTTETTANTHLGDTKKKQNLAKPFYIQIGSFLDESDAKTMQSNLKKEGINAYIVKAMVGGVSRYRVGYGDFLNRQSAQSDMKRLQDLTGIEPALQKREE